MEIVIAGMRGLRYYSAGLLVNVLGHTAAVFKDSEYCAVKSIAVCRNFPGSRPEHIEGARFIPELKLGIYAATIQRLGVTFDGENQQAR